jgi:hypothetical protein
MTTYYLLTSLWMPVRCFATTLPPHLSWTPYYSRSSPASNLRSSCCCGQRRFLLPCRLHSSFNTLSSRFIC